MKRKPICKTFLFVTAFAVLYLLQPGLLLQACVSTNQFCNHAQVPVNQITNLVPVSPPELATAKEDDDKVLAPIIFFVIMLIVFGYIIYQLIKLLDKIIPPPEKKPDPPPHSYDTNTPPIVINPTQGPGPVTASLKSLEVNSNTPSWGSIPAYDISALNYKDTLGKSQLFRYFDTYWTTGIQLTTNMIDWEDSHYRVDCFVNSMGGTVQYAYYHYGTNYWNCYYTADFINSNHIATAWFNLSDRPKQQRQFFRLNPK